jgi:hypothetical protein
MAFEAQCQRDTVVHSNILGQWDVVQLRFDSLGWVDTSLFKSSVLHSQIIFTDSTLSYCDHSGVDSWKFDSSRTYINVYNSRGKIEQSCEIIKLTANTMIWFSKSSSNGNIYWTLQRPKRQCIIVNIPD